MNESQVIFLFIPMLILGAALIVTVWLVRLERKVKGLEEFLSKYGIKLNELDACVGADKNRNCCVYGCNEVERENDSKTHCSNPECNHAELVYCPVHASRLLNTAGQCIYCSREEVKTCDGCHETFTSSKITHCAGENCDHNYCAGCQDGNLVYGLCEECHDKAA